MTKVKELENTRHAGTSWLGLSLHLQSLPIFHVTLEQGQTAHRSLSMLIHPSMLLHRKQNRLLTKSLNIVINHTWFKSQFHNLLASCVILDKLKSLNLLIHKIGIMILDRIKWGNTFLKCFTWFLASGEQLILPINWLMLLPPSPSHLTWTHP